MTQVAKPRKIVMKSRFRIEIDGVGDFRAITAGPLKILFNLVDTEEGGAATTANISVNGHKYDPVTIERPVTEDQSVVEWIKRLKRGIQDLRNGAVYALDTEGNDLYRWELEEIVPVDFEDFAGDAKAKEEQMMERLQVRYRERGERELLQ